MKNKYLYLLLATLTIYSCSSDETSTSENSEQSEIISSGDPIQDEIAIVLKNFHDGLKPGIAMSDIKKYDPEITEFESNNGPTGNFEILISTDQVEGDRFYEKEPSDPTKLRKIRCSFEFGNGDILDYNKYVQFVTDDLGSTHHMGDSDYGDENDYVWDVESFTIVLEPDPYDQQYMQFIISNQE